MRKLCSSVTLLVALFTTALALAQPKNRPADVVDVSHGLGIPFGGIGTGFSVFGKYGFVWVTYDIQRINGHDMDEKVGWKVDRQPDEKPTFAFVLTEGGKQTLLQETPLDWAKDAQPVDKVKAYARLPKGEFTFEKSGLNLDVTLTAFSPMAPHDLANSTVPVQVFDLKLTNTGAAERTLDAAIVSQQSLTAAGDTATLKDDHGSTAFTADGGTADAKGVRKFLTLSPGQSATVRYYIAWHYPKVITASPAMRQHYRAYYTKRFQNPQQVIEVAKQSADKWSAAIDRWHASFDVPPQFKRLWFSSLSSVITSTAMTDDPYFFEREIPHGWMNTMDVCAYSNWLYMINWPELERMDMDQYLKAIPKTGDNAGFVWHSLWDDGTHYAEEPTFIGRFHRDALWFNDADWTKAAFPVLNMAANRAYHSDNYRYLLHSKRGNQSYDLWMMPGVSSYVNVAWIYALHGLDQVSQRVGQPASVNGMPASEMQAKATQSLNDLLWNKDGKYWNTFFVPTDREQERGTADKPDGVDTFSDQLFGKWLNLIDPNATNVLPADRVKEALNTVYVNNLIDDPARNFRGWVNGMKPGRKPEYDGGTHARDCWFGPQEAMASLFADIGEEAKSLDVFNSLEASLHNNHLFVGEWNQSIARDGTSRIQPDEPHKDTPRFPPYPRYKSCWEYLVAMLGMKMDPQAFMLKPFRTIDFALNEVQLAGTTFTIKVQSGWTRATVNGQPAELPVRVPRAEKACRVEFVR